MTHEYSPYLDTEQTLDHQAPFGERTKVFTHPNLHKRKLNVDPGMLDVWELLNEHGINYTMLGLLCGVSGITISGRMINGCPADTKAEMKARIKSLDSLRVMEQSPPPRKNQSRSVEKKNCRAREKKRTHADGEFSPNGRETSRRMGSQWKCFK